MEASSGTKSGGMKAHKGVYVASGWDDEPMSLEQGLEIASLGNKSIFWGGNYYGMPASKCWLVWDKEKPDEIDQATCELAWTDCVKGVRRKKLLWNGMIRKEKE
jgi:hypothetical protein